MLLQARPQAIEIDPERTAIIVIDMQNDFGSKGGMFDRAGIDISGIQAAIVPTARAINAARKAGIPVIYLKMGFSGDLSDAGAPDSPNRIKHQAMHVGEAIRAPDGTEGRILIRDTWNTDIVSELKPQAEDIVVWKTRYSGFYQTELDNGLKRLNAKYLVITGCTTCVCVESTIRDAMFRDYSCVLLTDCAAEPIGHNRPTSNHEASLLLMEALFGWIAHSEDFVAAVEERAAKWDNEIGVGSH
jgi:ureidoacrylate peracid hydrolase